MLLLTKECLQLRILIATQPVEATPPKCAVVAIGCRFGPTKLLSTFNRYLLFKTQVYLGTGNTKDASCKFRFLENNCQSFLMMLMLIEAQ